MMTEKVAEPGPSMSIERVRALCRKGVQLWVHCGIVHFRDSMDVMSSDDVRLLRKGQRELVEQLIEMQAVGTGTDSAEQSALKLAPLSYQQEFALRYVGENFLGACAVKLSGTLDVSALSQSVNEILRRHQALRTNIAVVGGALKQRVLDFAERPLDIEDLRVEVAVDDEGIQSRLRSVIEHWMQRASSTFEVRVLRFGDSEYLLLVLWDHAFSDHQSGIILFRELWRLYRSFSEGRSVIPAAKTVQYPDYAVWQRSEYSRWLDMNGAYWDNRLRGAVALRLPIDSETQDTVRCSSTTISFGHELASALTEVSQRAGISLPLVVVSAVSIALSRWSGQQEFVVPYMFAGRYHSMHLEAVGYYPTPLLIRVKIKGGSTFISLMKGISQEFFSAICHLDIGKPLDGGVSAILQSALLQWFPAVPRSGVTLTPPRSEWDVQLTTLTVNPFEFDWSLPSGSRIGFFNSLWSEDNDIVGGCGYRADLYSKDAVDRYISDLRLVAKCIAANPSDRIDSIVALSYPTS